MNTHKEKLPQVTPKAFQPLVAGAAVVLSALAAVASPAQIPAQANQSRLIPFDEFRTSLRGADPAAYVGRAEARVADPTAFEEMRRHLISLYADMEVAHSYLLHGDIFDCVPIEQQPSVRLLHLDRIAETPPPLANDAPDVEDDRIQPATQLSDDDRLDSFGNSTECKDGTIPMRRITLEEVTRFPSLEAFLAKSPGESLPPIGRQAACTGAVCGHKYSFVYQRVGNIGGNSGLNLWSPAVNTKLGEVFSLSQQWYSAGSGAATVTVEAGWQNYPAKYGNQQSRLFIFHTSNNYKTGCYNLDCAGFVQIEKGVHLGGAFTLYSTTDGPQYEFPIKVKLIKGNWWMYYRNSAFGYYPAALFKGGAMAAEATLVEYGTESYSAGTTWPPEGSGVWSSASFGNAAFQRDLYYFNTKGVTEWDSLTRDEPSPTCYTINGPTFSSVAGWGPFFYEGGPGGKGC